MCDPVGRLSSFGRLPPGEEEDAAEEESEWRTMDCVDCHNRPTHVFGMPESEVDSAIQQGLIQRSLPYIRREAVKALRADYASHDAAREGIAGDLEAFYRDNYPAVTADPGEELAEAIEVLGDVYARNIFPTMNVTWGTYPNHIGHEESPGCFRCHDEEHSTEDGNTISQDCDNCHSLLAWEESDPEVLGELFP